MPDGTPVRATVSVILKEWTSQPCNNDRDCDAGERCQEGVCRWLGK